MARWIFSLPASVVILALGGCNIHEALPMPDNIPDQPPMEETNSPAGFDCFEAGSVVEDMACADPQLAAADKILAATLHEKIRHADIFGRDALEANQRAWLLGLNEACHLPAQRGNGATPDAAQKSCLLEQYAAQRSNIARWVNPPGLARAEGRAMGEYVRFKIDMQKDPTLCGGLAAGFVNALTRDRGVDISRVDGITPIAGSYAANSDGDFGGHKFHVEVYSANVFASYARRARWLTIDGGARVIDPLSLGKLIQAQNENLGGRFSAFASQTNDYGQVDVFAWQGRTLALVTEPWGFYTPAAAGENARAGIWEINGNSVTPVCLYSTYQAPAVRDAITKTLPHFSAWLDALDTVREAGDLPLSETTRRAQTQLRHENDWMVLNVPLMTRAQSDAGGWTPWLRRRHDQVLDAMAAWSDKVPANKAVFDKIFAEMRPAAQEVLASFQQTQGLDSAEAKDATAIAMLEILYGASVTIAPDLGSDLEGPWGARDYRAKYPIIASPS